MELKQIASFQVDHTTLNEGLYTSRIDGDITTYDLRMVRPNGGVYLENGAMHTFEHLFATFARSSPYEKNVVYVGPMGCRTGFYFLVRDLEPALAINLVRESLDFIARFEGEIPGVSARECGNYREHDLPGALEAAEKMRGVLQEWTVARLAY